ncbi:hypothetical protein [uncultured Paraburkholderia sp.]|uniref:hypothetical protein n=1 Tax=uncultured Paraburkholderia sp. TaxID=1822466 RepID=UPI002594AFD1|nr:hypothetical protein [uncultured Paraburkholderia sp.]
MLGDSDAKAAKAVQATPIGDARVSPGDGYGPRILVVDDDVASLDGTCELLTLIGVCAQPADRRHASPCE